MLDRTTLLGLAVAGLFVAAPAARSHAAAPTGAPARLAMLASEHEDGKKDDEKDEKKEKKEKKEIEQAVPMNMVPAAVLDAVKKEVPNGAITEAELEAKKGKILYAFDVKDGETTYDVKVTVDGKFYSKKVDDEKDEKK